MTTTGIQIGRPLSITEEFTAWLGSLALDVDPTAKLHTTIAYSRKSVDWSHSIFAPKEDTILVIGGERGFAQLDGGAFVLTFESEVLEKRWQEILAAGASWDYEGFAPHITLGFEIDLAMDSLPAYEGPLELGPEYRKTVSANTLN